MLLQLKAFVASIYGIVIIALLAALMIQTVRIEGFRLWPIHVAGLKAELSAEKTARAADRSKYTKAQADAQAKNREQVQRIEAEQEKVTHEIESDLNSRLERLRRELRQAPSSAGGSAGGAPAGPNGKPAQGAPGTSGLCLAPEVVLRAAENEERHDQLINWVEQQLQITR